MKAAKIHTISDATVRRAAELLELCRGRIRKAEVEVTQIVQSLETPADAAAEEGE